MKRYILLAIISLIISLSFGSVPVSLKQIFHSFSGSDDALIHTIIWQIRFPRIINGFITGASLALAGALMQALLRNPLADPYILGVSGGSAVFSLASMIIGITALSLTSMTFIGGLFAMIVVIGLSYRAHHWSSTHLLLTGVMFAAACNAIIVLMLSITSDSLLHSMMFWLIGEITEVHIVWPGAVMLIGCLLITLPLSQSLDRLHFGERKAYTLGIQTKQLKILLFVITALLTATAVSIAGPIGFVGLVVPHTLRLLGCYQHRQLIPASVLLGGSVVCLADTVARTILSPIQLPVGAITALIGVPIFLILLKSRAGE